MARALCGRPVHVLALVGLLMLGVVSALPLAAPAATAVSFAPTDDTYADAELPSATHGSEISMRVDGVPVRRAYVRFDVSGLTAPVTRATLRIYARTSQTLGFDVRSVTSTGWSEATLTYENAPAPSSVVTASSGPVTGGTWYELDVTRLVAGNGAVAFALTTENHTNVLLATKEDGAATAPQLVVETSAASSDSTAPATTAASTTTAATTTTTPPPSTTMNTSTTPTATTTGATTTSVSASSNVFTPTDDTFAHSDFPSTTHGSLAEFRVDGSPVLRGFLRFNVTGLAGPVTRATLKVYSRTSHSSGFEVRSVSSSGWTEATLTDANAPTPSTTVTGRSGALTAGTWAAVDVTSLVHGVGAVAFALTTTEATNLPLSAKELGADKAPQLVVETTAASTTTTGTTTTSPPPDTSPPTTPTGLATTGATTTSVSVSWNASSDNVGVAGYGVYVDGNLAGSTSQRSFTASGLTCGRSYVVTVDAYDAAGNRSAKSSALTTATSACADTQSPTTPGNLRATAATTSSVDVAWNASSDNVGVTGYNLYRDGSFVASTTATSYGFAGLTCGTSYAFGVEALDAAGNKSARASLTAATAACSPPSGGDPVVAVAGDIAGNGSGDSATAALLDSLAPTAVLTAGDNVYPDGTLAEFNAYYEPTWGRHKSKTYPSPGNHDYNSGGGGYYSYFGSRAGPSGKGFYSYNLGAWHLIALNSEVARGATSEQVTWLKNDLASTTAKCVMAYWHKPRFTAGNYSDDSSYQPFWDALYAANADVVINGHDHNYQRYKPMTPSGAVDTTRGIREFVVGTGGRSHYGLRADSRREAADSSSFGVLKLTLRASGYDWQFMPEAGRTFTDSGSGTCH